jgi:hypothetical protein
MNDLEKRLLQAMVGLVVGKRDRAVPKKEREAVAAKGGDTRTLDLEIKTMKDGLKATKAERDNLLVEYLRLREAKES